MKDYYSILGLNDKATEEEIKKTYRQLAKEYHPDKNPDGADKFKEISEAYETLSDPHKKSAYDNQKNNPFGNMGGGGSPFDIFSQMFGGRGQRPQRRGVDKIINIAITITESYLAMEKVIDYTRNVKCDPCNGSGGEKQQCNRCGGRGQIIFKTGTGFFGQVMAQTCDQCQGRGVTFKNVCQTCKGSASVPKAEKIQIKIPHGSDDGELLRIQNMGDFQDGAYGDLIVKVSLAQGEGMYKDGDNLFYDAVLTLDELKKGEFDVAHPEGKLTIKLPNTLTTQTPLRVKGKGFKRSGFGDFYLNIDLSIDRTQLNNN